MQRIVIVLDDMSIGGIPKACISFLKELIKYYDVTMLVSNTNGELIGLIPDQVSIKVIPRYGVRNIIRMLIAKHQYFRLISYVFPYLIYSRVFKRWVKSHELTARILGAYIDGEWDCAIAYHGMNISQMVTTLHNVKAKKKIAWIHGDHPFEGIHKKDIASVYEEFDKIYCVSPSMRERFLAGFPSVREKTDSYKNILDVEMIREKAKEEQLDFDSSFINIVTVGRVSPEKGQDMIPEITRKLLDSGYKIRWYIVGDGSDMPRIKALCTQCDVTDSVILVGSKQNPYPYMKQCDIYVQPSYSEGYCLTVCEAAILGKPIVLTQIAAAGILTDDENAIIAESNADSLTGGIIRMIDNPGLQGKFIKNLGNIDLSNRDEINKLIRFLK